MNKVTDREEGMIYPEPPAFNQHDAEKLDAWGFADTEFTIDDNNCVSVTGARYGLSGKSLVNFLPWAQATLGIEIDPKDLRGSKRFHRIEHSVTNQDFIEAIKNFLTEEQISYDNEQRIRHGHGHTLEDIYQLNYGRIARVPDCIVYPMSEEQIQQIIKFAQEHKICLIPYGGGTNVTQALSCLQQEKRMIVSVDMSRMNRILWIDTVNQMACIEAGAVGRHILEQLAQHGYTLGHEPDSVEFSTLGGWLATNASGMKKNRYGNIEDIAITLDVVGVNGALKRMQACPRESIGFNYKNLMIGSEGNLGIITKAVLKISPLPQVAKYGSLLFPNFEAGYRFLYDLVKSEQVPASVRLVDNQQFQFSMALKHSQSKWQKRKSQFERWYVENIKKFNTNEMVAATIVYEGHARDVQAQAREANRLMKRYGGMQAGAQNGQRGYELTFSIAYIRDFLLKHHIVAESFETSVPWNHALALCKAVKAMIHKMHQTHQLPGKPFVSCRITQLYKTGVCIYFYFGFYHKGVNNPLEIFSAIEESARETILKHHGSLSHHHGIGKLRKKFLPMIMSSPALDVIQVAKNTLDPSNVFGVQNFWQSKEINR